MHRPDTPLMMIERFSAAASSQPQRRARPVTVPRSCPTVDRWWPIEPGSSIGELGRERPAADPRRVGLGDAEDVVQQVGPDARAGGRVAGHAVARGDVRIGAVVDVEQRALRALEQDVGAAAVRVVERVADVADHRPQLLAGPHRHLEDRLEGERLGVQEALERRSCAARAARAAWRRSAPDASGPARAARGARPCPRRPGRCPCRWCRSCRRRSIRACASRALSTATWNGRISGHDSLIRRRERTSSPIASSRPISPSRCCGSTTTPLPM